MDIVAFGTPFGLAFASGLNAYLPLLAFTLSVRWLHLYSVNPHLAFVTHTWFMAILAALTILDFVADKIPFIDHIWNAIHSAVRPIAGAFVALVASSHALPVAPITGVTGHAAQATAIAALTAIPITAVGLVVVLVLGGLLALLSHSTKSTTRFLSTLTTAGVFNGVLSVVEDVLVVIVIVLSLFASGIMLILLILLVLVLVPQFVRTRTMGKGRRWRL